MEKLEQQLNDMFVTKAPFQVPENGRKGLAGVLPWLTLAGGVLMLWAAWGLFQLVMYADRWSEVANGLSAAYGNASYIAPVASSPLIWLSLGILIVEAVLFFMAFPVLRAFKKSGWTILFWVALINAVQSVVQAVAYGNMGSLVMSLISTVIGLYLLFQVRAYFTGEKKIGPDVPTTPTKPTDKTV